MSAATTSLILIVDRCRGAGRGGDNADYNFSLSRHFIRDPYNMNCDGPREDGDAKVDPRVEDILTQTR